MSIIGQSTETPIVSVISRTGDIHDIGAASAKAMPAHSRYRYSQSVDYTLSDGRIINQRITGITKPKLLERVAALDAQAKSGELFAGFRAGVFWGTIRKFSLIP